MSRLLWLDPVGGVAGDMLCAALLDAGGDLDALRDSLSRLPIDGYRIETPTVMRGPFAARRFVVVPTAGPAAAPAAEHDHSHDHGHSHGHDHAHAHAHVVRVPWPGQPDRRWSSIRRMLEQAELPERARERALSVFGALARSEAAVHGMPVEDVHFHEVGAIDSIVDIVSACLLMEQLGVDAVRCGPLPLGSGTTHGEHGTIPLPAPATARLLVDWPVTPGHAGMEQVTPTGAALVAGLAEPGGPAPMVLRAVGTGAGGRDPAAFPNVLRVLLGDEGTATARHTGDDASQHRPPTTVTCLAAQLDDLPGERLPALMQALLDAGAVDVTATPVLMKKGRSGLLVEAQAAPDRAELVAEALLRHGGTFGLRRWTATREVLDRWHETVQTPYGPIRVKVGARRGEVLHRSPEHADVAAAAREADVAEALVHAAALAAACQAAAAQAAQEAP